MEQFAYTEDAHDFANDKYHTKRGRTIATKQVKLKYTNVKLKDGLRHPDVRDAEKQVTDSMIKTNMKRYKARYRIQRDALKEQQEREMNRRARARVDILLAQAGVRNRGRSQQEGSAAERAINELLDEPEENNNEERMIGDSEQSSSDGESSSESSESS